MGVSFVRHQLPYVLNVETLSTPLWEFRIRDYPFLVPVDAKTIAFYSLMGVSVKTRAYVSLESPFSLSTPLWEFHVGVVDLVHRLAELLHLSTPLWEFRTLGRS